MANTVISQSVGSSVITYIAEVPLVVESGVYGEKMADSKTLVALTGKIRIAFAPRQFSIPSDHYFKTGKPLPVGRYSELEYLFFINKDHRQPWYALPTRHKEAKAFPYGGLVADTSLKVGDKAVLQFRFKASRQLVQEHIFSRSEILPVIQAYRQTTARDSIGNRIKSLTANDPTKKWIGFDSLVSDHLILLPGKNVELLFKKRELNTDSAILYRIRESGVDPGPVWQLTGHLLSLSNIRSGHSYTLEAKYKDMDLYNRYTLTVQPYWYQAGWAIFLFSLFGLTILLLVPFGIYRYRLGKEVEKRKRLEDQLTTVQSQLNPHFVYNAISSIEGLVTNKENERANEYLNAFSDIMRHTLKNSREAFISLSMDLDMLEKYIRIEQLRFEFKWIMETDPALDLDMIEFPPMLLQPVVENAIKHGIAGAGAEGILFISFKRMESDLLISIRNNTHVKHKPANNGTGYGLKLTKERMDHLRKLYKTENIKFDISFTEFETVVSFYFENWITQYEGHYH